MYYIQQPRQQQQPQKQQKQQKQQEKQQQQKQLQQPHRSVLTAPKPCVQLCASAMQPEEQKYHTSPCACAYATKNKKLGLHRFDRTPVFCVGSLVRGEDAPSSVLGAARPSSRCSHRWPVGTFTGGLQRPITPRVRITYITQTKTPGTPLRNLEDDVGLRNGAPTLVGGRLEPARLTNDAKPHRPCCLCALLV